MKPYDNLSGNSGVMRYEPGSNCIAVEFRNGDIYLYDYWRPGRSKVEIMKRLAAAGRGLATFINKHVRDNYARKLR